MFKLWFSWFISLDIKNGRFVKTKILKGKCEYKKVFVWFIFILFFLSLGVLGLTRKEVRIQDINISGNSTVTSGEILAIVEEKINERYLWIIPTDNILLFQRLEIPRTILDRVKKVESVYIKFVGLTKINIEITERVPEYSWCKNKTKELFGCYLMDKDGFIFSELSTTDSRHFVKYFGLITSDNPIGQNYFNNLRFGEINNFFVVLKNMNLNPYSFNAISINEYEVDLVDGGKILLNNKEIFEKTLINLQSLINDGYIKKKINHIDLRYGNKVHFDFRP
ncbi:MAG: hypothetical protein NTU76_01615 [Candidatus Taylorbacteria bacterium]|nr:hypothetical protein [Candidatus Taylorbacteria bacterium]